MRISKPTWAFIFTTNSSYTAMASNDKRVTQLGHLIALPRSELPAPDFLPDNPIGHTDTRHVIRKRKRGEEIETEELALRNGKGVDRALRVLEESPQIYYKLSFGHYLGELFTFAVKKTQPYTCVAIRQYSTSLGHAALKSAGELHHRNILNAIEAFKTEDSIYILFEDTVTTLENVIQSTLYPDDLQLNAIIGQ
ncbi:hypothetical protein JX266_014433, partial [Neoarthrinium moseri]